MKSTEIEIRLDELEREIAEMDFEMDTAYEYGCGSFITDEFEERLNSLVDEHDSLMDELCGIWEADHSAVSPEFAGKFEEWARFEADLIASGCAWDENGMMYFTGRKED